MSERMTFFCTPESSGYGPRVFLFDEGEKTNPDAFMLAKLLCKWSAKRTGRYIGYEFSYLAFDAMVEWLRSHDYIEVSDYEGDEK